jgi:hypothetical protein
MIQLRWAIPPTTTTKPPALQYRQGGKGQWTDWLDVPTVVVDTKPKDHGFNSGDLIAAMFRDGAGS